MENHIHKNQSWSNSFLEPYQTFKNRYALEMLHSLGFVFDNKYSTNTSLQTMMISLAKRDEKNFYKLALIAYQTLQKDESVDLMTIFNENEFEHSTLDLSKPDEETLENDQLHYDVSVVHVTPTCTKIMPIERIQGHRGLRHSAFNDVNDFCLVYFKSDKEGGYVNSNPYYEMVLKSGILLCNIRYHLFGASNSQLREHSYWFIKANSYKEVDDKRAQLGDFSEITNVGKYLARFGLWFNFDQRIQNGDYCVKMIGDIERNGYCFTDGNGFISKGLAKLVAKNLDYPIENIELDIYPSAYQIRMAGCKGLVVVEPQSTLDQFYIKIRPSMKKFKSNDWTLEICEASQPIPTRLNNQVIMIMSDLGVPDKKFLDLQYKWFRDEKKSPDNSQDLLKNKIPMPVNECRYMFGCAIESSLEPGKCFIRYQVVDDDGQLLKNPRFETVVGRVIVTKNPCLHAGDMLELEAVDNHELYCLTDVIVFSTKDESKSSYSNCLESNLNMIIGPDPNKISGSDLDGDHYFVYWGQDLKLSRKVDPLDYTPFVSQCPPKSSPITHTDILRHCYSLFNAITCGEIYNLHATVVDKNLENCKQITCQKLAVELANMFSAAIDSSKTGYVADRKRINQIRKLVGKLYPDFLMKNNSYESQSILGKLYRLALEYKNKNSDKFRNQENILNKNTYGNFRMRNIDSYLELDSRLAINPHIICRDFTTSYSLKASDKSTPAIWISIYQKKYKNIRPLEKCKTVTQNSHIVWFNAALTVLLSYSCAMLLFIVFWFLFSRP
ncbi:unnamed protein product [Rotaria sp. Silwood2]|nr:unnamed protein product [Rotaria sp. Silwood2]